MTEDMRPFGDPGSDSFRVEAYPFYLLNRSISRYNVVIDSLLREIGIVAHWQEYGWPEICRPLDGESFRCD